MKLIKKHGNITEAIPYIKNADFPHPVEEIKDLFINPRITDEFLLEWNKPDVAGLIGFLCGEHNFNQQRVMSAINKLKKGLEQKTSRTTLDRFFG